MARRGWFNLSDAYRARLQRNSITRSQYESGVPLRGARGHARTPEHPGQGVGRPEFQPYYEQRLNTEEYDYREDNFQYEETPGLHSDEVKQALAERLIRAFGDRHKFRGAHDPDYPPLNYPPAPDDETILETLELDDYELEALATDNPEYWFLWYH